jgi:hypothetical protein
MHRVRIEIAQLRGVALDGVEELCIADQLPP